MSEKRFTIKPQDDYWAVVDNYNEDKVCIINGIHTEIEAIWLCDFMNEQQATISQLKEENDILKQKLRKNYIANKQYEEMKRLQEKNEQLRHELDSLTGCYCADNKEFKDYWRIGYND